MIKVFRPFWSYDVKKTETWLSTMAENSNHLVQINRWTHCFFFQQEEPKTITYRIGFEKLKGTSQPNALLSDNWESVTQNGKWYFLSNEEPPDQIETSPIRDGIIKHNRNIMYIFFGIFLYLTFIAVFNLAIIGLFTFGDAHVEVVPSPMWILTYSALGIAIVVYVISIYSMIKINKSNKDLER